MTNTVLIKRSSTANSVPLAGNLSYGELAINYTDGNLFYKNAGDVVTVIASNKFSSVSGNVTGGNIVTLGTVSTSNLTTTGTVNLVSSGNISLGNVGNIHITGGSSGYVLSTNGSGLLSWVAQSGGNTGGSTITVNDFTGNGVQTEFTLSVTPPNIDYTTVNYNGVIQLRTGYTLNGANIVFATAPVANSSIEVTTISPNITIAGGANTEVQFNDSGNLGASPAFTFNSSSNVLSVNGNVDATYFIGNGSQLTGISTSTSKIFNGTSEANIGTSGGNANITIGGTSNVVVVANTGMYVTGVASASGNVTGGNILTGGLISATSTITSAANITGGNVLTGGLISATANITGAYFIGNGSQLTGLPASYSDANVATYLASGTDSSNIITTGNVSGGNILTSGLVSATGNLYGNSLVISTGTGGNVTGANVISANVFSASGNVTGAYFIGNGSQLTGISTSTSKIFNGTSEANIGTANGNANISIAGTSNVVVVANTGMYVTGVVSASGNISTGANIVVGAGTGGNLTGANVISATTLSATANITGGNILTGGLISSTGNISSAGNVSATYFLGNGSQLTGITSGYGNANVATYLASGTDTSNIITTANVTGGNVTTTGLVTATGNIYGGNFVAGSGTGGNITGANLITSNIFSASGNVTAAYFIGNGSQLTGISTSASKIYNGTSEANIGTANGNANISIAGTSNVVVVASTGMYVTGVASASGNVTGGNVLTGGLVSATANVTGGNILTGGLISASGNVTGGNIIVAGGSGGNLTGANVISANTFTATANITGGNVLTGGLISATGNVYGASFVGNVAGTIVSASSNITGGNILTAGLVSAAGAGIFGGGLSVTGNITATGNINYQNVTDLVVGDPLIYIGANNTSDLVDLGIVASANVANVYQHLGIVRNHNTAVWNFFSNVVAEPTTVIDWANAVLAPVAGGSFAATTTVSAGGNITGGNVLTGGLISATGNISSAGNVSATYFLGNGSQLTGISTSATKIFNGTSEANIGTSGGNANITIGGTSNVVVVATTGIYVTGVASASGNITGGNVVTAGLITATGTITGSSVLGSVVSASGNITGGNVVTGGLVSATGNVTGNYFIGNGSLLTGITGSNLTATVDNFTGNGTANTFTLSTTPSSANVVLVNYNGTFVSHTSYSVTGNTLTFGSAPANGANIEVSTFSGGGGSGASNVSIRAQAMTMSILLGG